jgi:hypothetical protein
MKKSSLLNFGLVSLKVDYVVEIIELTQYGVDNQTKIMNGDAGYRSQYLLHAKQALYHLSYIPLYRLKKNSNFYSLCFVLQNRQTLSII